MQRDNESRLQYLMRVKYELLLENAVKAEIRELIDESQEEEQPKPKRGRPANNPQPPQQQLPPRLSINGNGNQPAFRNDSRRLPAPPTQVDGDDQS